MKHEEMYSFLANQDEPGGAVHSNSRSIIHYQQTSFLEAHIQTHTRSLDSGLSTDVRLWVKVKSTFLNIPVTIIKRPMTELSVHKCEVNALSSQEDKCKAVIFLDI